VQKRRAKQTLEGIFKTYDTLVTDAEVGAFVDFLDANALHSFFWVLHSFEMHLANTGTFVVSGMHSDLQAMAVVVEHVGRALGSSKKQLYEIFKEHWDGTAVGDRLRDNQVGRLARQARVAGDWTEYMQEIERMRASSPIDRIVADLVLAHRLRGALHNVPAETNRWSLENLFVALMRAATLTFAHVRKGMSPAPVDAHSGQGAQS